MKPKKNKNKSIKADLTACFFCCLNLAVRMMGDDEQ